MDTNRHEIVLQSNQKQDKQKHSREAARKGSRDGTTHHFQATGSLTRATRSHALKGRQHRAAARRGGEEGDGPACCAGRVACAEHDEGGARIALQTRASPLARADIRGSVGERDGGRDSIAPSHGTIGVGRGAVIPGARGRVERALVGQGAADAQTASARARLPRLQALWRVVLRERKGLRSGKR